MKRKFTYSVTKHTKIDYEIMGSLHFNNNIIHNKNKTDSLQKKQKQYTLSTQNYSRRDIIDFEKQLLHSTRTNIWMYCI